MRNLLNWVAFLAIVGFLALFFFAMAVGETLGFFEAALVGGDRVLARFTNIVFYGYLLWCAFQYVVWKDVVLLPPRYKVEDE